MKVVDWLMVEANVFRYKGRHWLDKQKKARFMEYRGVVFKWNPKREIWERYKKEGI